MSKWQVQSWGGEFLKFEADSMTLQDGALIFSRKGHESIALADGVWQTAHNEEVVLRTVSAPRELHGAPPLALVVDIEARSKGESGTEAAP